jgi:cycloeucalenol cycloisomerase
MGTHIAITMALILGAIIMTLLCVSFFLNVLPGETGTFLPLEKTNLAKRQFEVYALGYSCVWIGIFGVVVAMKLYEQFDENSYMKLCVTLALPFLLQPIVWPMPAERNLPLIYRYSFKANLWIAIFSFIGNYWYTHYFYSVLEARYTFPSHRLNDVPISMFFATHFYFVTYHTFSNLILRKIQTRYVSSWVKVFFFWMAIFAFAYFTAFMETLTISSFPCYAFTRPIEDIFTMGSAFYGIYFIASFPIFFALDECENGAPQHSTYQAVLEAMGCGMIVLLMLDFCRLYFGIDFRMSAEHGAVYLFENQCSFE